MRLRGDGHGLVPREVEHLVWDLIECDNVIRCSDFCRFTWHAIDDATGFILRNRRCTVLLHGE